MQTLNTGLLKHIRILTGRIFTLHDEGKENSLTQERGAVLQFLYSDYT